MKEQDQTNSTNIKWHNLTIDRDKLEKMRGHKGMVIWFTGLSGSGKSTLANALNEVLHLDGFSMLINKNNFDESDYFDENFFLYLENNDLCLRVKKNNQKIYVIKNSIIEHRGGASSDPNFSQIEYLKNWHWMWSKFYYHHKHDSYLYAFMKIFKNLISAFIKTIFYTILRNNKKIDFYKARLSGCINGLLLKKSWYRID